MEGNWEASVLKALGGRDFRLTVLGNEPVGDRYRRLLFDDGGLLEACGSHPTMWIRLWFDNDGKPHQRAYTLVDPDPTTGRFTVEFALHDGCAARWSTTAADGDIVDATVQGSEFRWPNPHPRHMYLVGDAASLPAVNSLLAAAKETPATIWLEYAHEGEQVLPVRGRPGDTLTWLPRKDGGRLLVDTVHNEVSTDTGSYYWLAAEASCTRAITRRLRRDLGIDKHSILALAYWSAS